MFRLPFAALLGVPLLIGLDLQPGQAAGERSTALVTIARANAQCLIRTKTMTSDDALNVANRFLDAQGVSQDERRQVEDAPGFKDLMNRYINDRGGCQAIVRQLK